MTAGLVPKMLVSDSLVTMSSSVAHTEAELHEEPAMNSGAGCADTDLSHIPANEDNEDNF